MTNRQLHSLVNNGAHAFFVLAASCSSGTVTLLLGISETWRKGGVVLDVSLFGHWLLFLSGFSIGGAEAIVLLVVAKKYVRPLTMKVNGLAYVVIGIALGCITGFSFCLVVSVLFFTFPFPHLWELMTEEHHS